MNTAADALRAAAAQLLAKASEIDGQGPAVPGFDINNWRSWWPAMQEQAANNRKPHEWVDWAPGVLPEQAGNNVEPPAIYEGAKPFWTQMERQVPLVYDDHGLRFNALTCLKRGNDDFERNVRRLWNGPEGDAYRADPRTDGIWQRIKV